MTLCNNRCLTSYHIKTDTILLQNLLYFLEVDTSEIDVNLNCDIEINMVLKLQMIKGIEILGTSNAEQIYS